MQSTTEDNQIKSKVTKVTKKREEERIVMVFNGEVLAVEKLY